MKPQPSQPKQENATQSDREGRHDLVSERKAQPSRSEEEGATWQDGRKKAQSSRPKAEGVTESIRGVKRKQPAGRGKYDPANRFSEGATPPAEKGRHDPASMRRKVRPASFKKERAT